MSEEVEIDVAALLAAVVVVLGGDVEVPFETIDSINPESLALALDPNPENTGLLIRVVDATEVNYE